jgi:HlyD family secretion protein
MNPSLRARLLQPQVIIIATAVVALVAVGVAYVSTTPKAGGSYISPTQGSIVEEVDATGDVKAADAVDLSFETSGRISYVSAAVGSHVGQGAALASIDSADLQAAVEQAKAALQVQQAKLDALNAGATPQSIAVAQTAVTSAQNSLAQATQNLAAAAQSAYVASDDAVHNKSDQIFSNPRSITPTLVFNLSNSQLQASIQSDRVSMESLLTQWQVTLSALPSDPSDAQADSVVTLSQTDLARVQSYLDEVASGLTQATPSSSYPQAVITGYQSTVAIARTNISAAISALNAAQTAQTSAKNALAAAQSSLTLAQAPATSQDTEQQVAQIASAQANVDAAEAQLSKTAIRAPFSGTITVNNAHLGETASPGAPLISMISDAQFQFEVFVSQADLAKLKVGDTAAVELDAYESAVPLAAHVVAIDPAATVQNGASSYKVTLQFDATDSRIQAGLTGSAKITTQSKDNVLSVPTSAIITQGTQHFVLRETPSGDQQVAVQTGISSAAGMTEITSGLTSTDMIRTFGQTQ